MPNLTVNIADFTTLPIANASVELTPVFPYSIVGSSIITPDKLSQKTGSTGITVFPNVVAGSYTLSIYGPYTELTAQITVSGTTDLNAKDLIDLPVINPDATTAYSKVASDARYALQSSLSNYYTKTQSDARYMPLGTAPAYNFSSDFNVSGLNVSLAHTYVDTSANQTVGGLKTFSGATTFSSDVTINGIIESENINYGNTFIELSNGITLQTDAGQNITLQPGTGGDVVIPPVTSAQFQCQVPASFNWGANFNSNVYVNGSLTTLLNTLDDGSGNAYIANAVFANSLQANVDGVNQINLGGLSAGALTMGIYATTDYQNHIWIQPGNLSDLYLCGNYDPSAGWLPANNLYVQAAATAFLGDIQGQGAGFATNVSVGDTLTAHTIAQDAGEFSVDLDGNVHARSFTTYSDGTGVKVNGLLSATTFQSGVMYLTTTHTISATDPSTIILSSAGFTVTLPSPAAIEGMIYTIKLVASGSATVAAPSGYTIDGASSKSLSAQYKYMTVLATPFGWFIIANN